MTLAVSCSKDSDDPEPAFNPTAERLKGAVWHYYKLVEKKTSGDHIQYHDYYWTLNANPKNDTGYAVSLAGFDSSMFYWYVDKDNKLWISQEANSIAPNGVGNAIHCTVHTIISLTDSQMILGNYLYEEWPSHLLYLERVPYVGYNEGYYNDTTDPGDSEEINPGNNPGENTTTTEAPEVGFYDYTAYPTRLKVQFQIFNQDKAKVTSATGYYGTSSASKSTSASVSGRIVTVNLSGLSKGTKYKVKVTVKGAGGSTTSETVTCMTEY